MRGRRLQRLLQLIALLRGPTSWNAPRLADHFHTSRRNVYRDLAVLELAGVPFWYDPDYGEGGGYRIRESFFFPHVGLTEQECYDFAMVARLVQGQGIPSVGEVCHVRDKLFGTLPAPQQRLITEASELFDILSVPQADKDAQAKVYRVSFDQKSIQRFSATGTTIGRNVTVVPGTYDFGQKRSTWQLHLWYWHHAESKAGDMTFPEDTDACCLLLSFDQDEITARKWKEAFDRGSLRVTVWFRLASVEKRAWKNDPRILDGTQSHDIAFRADVLHVEFTTDGTEPALQGGSLP